MRRKYMIFASLFHIDYGTEQFSVEWLDNCASVNDAVDKVRKREVKEFKELRHTKYMWLKDKSRYTPNDRMRFDKLENAEYQVSQAWKVKELFRDLLRLHYHGDMEAYDMLGDWMADALRYNIGEPTLKK